MLLHVNGAHVVFSSLMNVVYFTVTSKSIQQEAKIVQEIMKDNLPGSEVLITESIVKPSDEFPYTGTSVLRLSCH